MKFGHGIIYNNILSGKVRHDADARHPEEASPTPPSTLTLGAEPLPIRQRCRAAVWASWHQTPCKPGYSFCLRVRSIPWPKREEIRILILKHCGVRQGFPRGRGEGVGLGNA